MLTPLKFKQNFAALPLFFQVFAIACSLMLALAVYGFLIDSFREARVFLAEPQEGYFGFYPQLGNRSWKILYRR